MYFVYSNKGNSYFPYVRTHMYTYVNVYLFTFCLLNFIFPQGKNNVRKNTTNLINNNYNERITISVKFLSNPITFR